MRCNLCVIRRESEGNGADGNKVERHIARQCVNSDKLAYLTVTEVLAREPRMAGLVIISKFNSV